MPVPAMVEPVGDHQKRFQAAVDVIHKLPKNGSYRPSYEVMLRFYSLYKQAVCGPCTVPRPGFWDPVGRYKWDAWSQLGEMSSESAMAAYVDEMKKVAQEVIETMPMDEKTASLFDYFEPLYLVIDDMPQPPESLLKLREGSEHAGSLTKMKDKDEEKGELKENASPPGNLYSHCNVSLSEVVDLSLCTIQNVAADSAVSEIVPLTSDSESEIFCDSVDSLEQLTNIKTKSDSFHNGHLSPESSAVQSQQEGRKVGAGQGGEGGEGGEGRKDPIRRTRHTGRETSHHSWRERGAPPGGLERSPGGGSGHGHGGDGSEGGAERLREAHLQQQIILALRRLREDMRSVMDRLEAVERLAATHAHASDLRPCLRCSLQQEQNWWPFDVSGQTVLLFLLWPFVAHCLVYLLRKKSCASS